MSDIREEEIESRFGRRRYDMDCQFHTEQLEKLQATVNVNTGKYTSLMWFIGVIGTIIGCCLTILVSKTTSIESLLIDNKVVLAQHDEQIGTLRKEVDALKLRVDALASTMTTQWVTK